jgi:hypothetical protein
MDRRPHSFHLALALFATLIACNKLAAQAAPSVPRLTFTKTLKGSVPEFMALSIDTSGLGTYDSHNLADAAAARPLQLSSAATSQIFSLAESLNNFDSLDLDSHRKVANMGLKTLSYDSGKESHHVEYNYTENRSGEQLTELLEKICNVEERISELEYEMKYDHLNLPQTLARIQDEMADHELVEAQLMMPALEKITNNPRYLHLAKARAQEIMQQIQVSK